MGFVRMYAHGHAFLRLFDRSARVLLIPLFNSMCRSIGLTQGLWSQIPSSERYAAPPIPQGRFPPSLSSI